MNAREESELGARLTRHVEERATEALGTESPRERRELIDQLVRLFEKHDG